MPNIDILVPAKNEAENIPKLLERIKSTFASTSINYRVIIIDDYSTDTTAAVLDTLSNKYPVVRLAKTGLPGKAFAILEGANFSTAPILAMLDADLEYPPEVIPAMYKQLPKHGVVVANRVSLHKSRFRNLASKVNKYIFGRIILGLGCDVQSGLKVFHREIIDHLDPKLITAWALDMPLLHTARELGYTVGTVDVEFTPRSIGLSKCKSELTTAIRQIAVGALRIKLASSRVYHLPGLTPNSGLGAGLVHKRQRFITHTNLPLHLSALRTFVPWQIALILGFIFLLIVGMLVRPFTTALTFVGLLTSIYFLDVLFNCFLVLKSLHFPPELTFTSEQIAKVKNEDLPVYTILCPLYKESRVLPHFVANIQAIDWPKSKLEVLILLEEDDQETQATAKSINLPDYFKVLVVPKSQPKTKPKACNYGLAHATGEYTVIYDAEDRPDPDQLKKAYLGFINSKSNVVCLQGKLNYFNPHQNLLTRLFTAEYSLWFDITLPGLQSINTAIPLGGTSNHFKTSILRSLHGWDSFNVTEDADLGARLFKSGYITAIIDSVTLEEANSHWGNWFRQRSRWIKGYIQTYLVHNRNPFQFIRQKGIHAFLFQLIVGGKIAFMLINPLLWFATISYFTLYQFVGPTIESLYPSIIFYMAIVSLVFGNFLFLFYYMIGAAKRGHWSLIKYIYFVPIYWLMVSLAAFKALNQLIFNPHYWEKTNHGLHLPFKVSKKISTATSVPVLPTPRLQWISSGFILVVAAMLANVLNFVYTAYLGRVTGFAEFGLISLVGSFLNLSQIPLSAFSRTINHRSAFILGKYSQPARALWQHFRAKSFPISISLTGVWLLSIPLLMTYFHTSQTLPFLIFTPIWFLGTFAAVDSGFLSGSLRFSVIALMTISEAVTKLVVTVYLVEIGLPHLLYFALPVSTIVSFLIGWIAAHHFKSRLEVEQTPSLTYFPKKFFISTVFSKVSSIAFLNIDLVLAKHYLSDNAAGEYALLSTVGKIVYFLGALFTQFITPYISRNEGAGHSSKTTITALVLLTLGSTLMGVAIFGLLGFLFVPFLFGDKAWVIVDYLPAYTLSMACVVVAGAIVSYHQARGKHSFSSVGFIYAICLIIGIILHHSSVSAINDVIVYGGVGYLGLVLLLHRLSTRFDWFIKNSLDLFGAFFDRHPHRLTTMKPRILIFNWRDTKHVWAGGAEVYLHELSKQWIAAGYSVTVFCGNDGHSARNEVVDGVQVVRRGGFYTVYIWAFLYYILKFRNQFDIVIDSNAAMPFFSQLYSQSPVILVTYHVHQEVFQNHLIWPAALIAKFLESRLMPFVYHRNPIITISQSSKDGLVKLGIDPKRISIVEPGTTAPTLTFKKTSQPSYIYFGRLKPYKRVDIAIKAFATLLSKFPAATLTIAGSGESKTNLENLASELGISNSVQFVGRVSDTKKWELLGSHWIAIQPSTAEGWGITVIEANACKTPVIASNIPGLRDSVNHEHTGLLVAPESIQEFTAAMLRLTTDRSLRNSMAAEGVIWASRFDWTQASRRFALEFAPKTITHNSKYYLHPSSL